MLAFWSYKHCLPRTQMTGRLASLRGALLSSFLSTAGDWKGCTVLLTTSLPESEQQSRNLTIFVVVDKRGLSLLKGKQWLFQSKIPPRSISGPLLRCHAHVQNSTEPRKNVSFLCMVSSSARKHFMGMGDSWRALPSAMTMNLEGLRGQQQRFDLATAAAAARSFEFPPRERCRRPCSLHGRQNFLPSIFFLRQSSFCPETSLDCAQDIKRLSQEHLPRKLRKAREKLKDRGKIGALVESAVHVESQSRYPISLFLAY